jgi:uncharacterized protein YcaQ
MARTSPRPPVPLTSSQARAIWLRAQRLDTDAPFGSGPAATLAAIEQLGYVQIDTIHVIERCHHHILFTRIPEYRRSDLHHLQDVDKTIFEYWTHALAYVPTKDMRFFVRSMTQDWSRKTSAWFGVVRPGDLRKVLARIRKHGALTIRDIDDDVLQDKDHEWGSRKPSKRALQLAFFQGTVTISQRSGMLKTYELTTRHFGWDRLPKAASKREGLEYRLDRALRSQGVVSLDSMTYLKPSLKPSLQPLIQQRVRKGELVPVAVEGAGKIEHWATPQTLETPVEISPERVHLLSPFDPLVNQRKRCMLFFGYEHRFEAYVPKPKRVFGYFALPVLVGDRVVAAIDLKTDREQQRVLLQQWTWIGKGPRRAHKRLIEEALHRFERFQLAR